MASLSKIYENQKLLGQVYTPNFIVEKILDDIGFNNTSILGKKIVDPACGDGRFLELVVLRIIKFSPISQLKKNLECVYGWDIDADAIHLCIQNLNQIIEPHNINIEWNISVTNSIEKIKKQDLFFCQSEDLKFDFIVGNPPYIRIQHLEEFQRKFIQENYTFCKSGSTDIYIAFYELSLYLLSEDGVCGFITPNTFFYTETARSMREVFAQKKHIRKITNYGNIQLFDNATTYSAILIFDKKENAHFLLEQAYSKLDFLTRIIDLDELKSQKFWQLSVKKAENSGGVRLKEICKIHVGITTLCDRAYIFPIENIGEKYVWAETKLKGRVRMERAILRPIIKGSTLKNGASPIKEYVLFPYEKQNGKTQLIEEQRLMREFPLAYEYLKSVKSDLDRRDNGKKNRAGWYAFGRSQGLETSFGRKIIFSPMNAKPNFILSENEEATFYSGYCIKFDGDYQYLLNQLNSERLADFIAVSSRDFRGGWKAYNKKTLEEFTVIK